MGTSKYDLPLIAGNSSVKIPRDFNALSTKVDESLAKEAARLDAITSGLASGSPKGVYNTVADLQAAKPSGDANIYLVLENGKWYYYNGSGWVAGSVYQGVEIADASISKKKISAELTATFEELSKIGAELIVAPDVIASLTLTTFFDVYTSVSITSGIVSGVKKTSPTAIVGGGLFDTSVKQIQWKGTTTNKYIVLAFDGTTVYHMNINGTTVSLRKHTAITSLGTIASYTLPSAVTTASLVKVVLAATTIDLYVDGTIRLQIPNNATTVAYFSNRQLGFLQVPAGDISLNSVSLGLPKTKIPEIETNIFNLQQALNVDNKFDLVMFMGQSNMAGRGTAVQAPIVPTGVGYEFRAISDPTKLNNIVEPFGVAENVTGAITEGTKTGSLVSAFAIEYQKITGVPIVGVSAAKGGTSINEWQPGGALLNDAVNRFDIAKTWMVNNNKAPRRKYMVWLQGETDGENGMSAADYKTKFKAMVDHMIAQGIEKCYVIRIGNHSTDPARLDQIITAQTDYAKVETNVVMVSTKLAGMTNKMKDTLHFTQEGLNTVGIDAAKNVAFHIRNDKEPSMYDPETDALYFSKK